MAIAEYKPISISLKTIIFKITIIVSTITITSLILIFGLIFFAILLIKSLPPVDAFTFNIIAVPKPTIIPPYIHAKTLSFVRGVNLSKISKKNDKLIVPIIDFTKNCLPILYTAIKNSGTFKNRFVIPIGILNK